MLRQVNVDSGNRYGDIGSPHFVGTLDSFINNYAFLRFGYLMNNDTRKRPTIIFENNRHIYSKNKDCYKCNINEFHWGTAKLLKNGVDVDTACDIDNKPCKLIKKI